MGDVPVEVPDPIIRRVPMDHDQIESYAATLGQRMESFAENGEIAYFFDRHGRLLGPYTLLEAGAKLEGIDEERDRMRQLASESAGGWWDSLNPSFDPGATANPYTTDI